MKMLLIGERYRDSLERALHFHGFEPYWLPDNPLLDKRLASHTDLSVFKHDNTVVLARHLFADSLLVKLLTNRGYKVYCCRSEQNIVYPNDVLLCACCIGDRIIHNSKYTDASITENACTGIIHVNQGYARCTVLAVDDNSIITADEGVAEAARIAGMEVLKISNEGIELEGFDQGFIGGASFKAGGTIYFTGKLGDHPDTEAIRVFIEERGLGCCSLTDKPLFDIGGAVYLE